jgi:hypothetical protein
MATFWFEKKGLVGKGQLPSVCLRIGFFGHAWAGHRVLLIVLCQGLGPKVRRIHENSVFMGTEVSLRMIQTKRADMLNALITIATYMIVIVVWNSGGVASCIIPCMEENMKNCNVSPQGFRGCRAL